MPRLSLVYGASIRVETGVTPQVFLVIVRAAWPMRLIPAIDVGLELSPSTLATRAIRTLAPSVMVSLEEVSRVKAAIRPLLTADLLMSRSRPRLRTRAIVATSPPTGPL